KDEPPGHAVCARLYPSGALNAGSVAEDVSSLGVVDKRMRGRVIAEPAREEPRPDDAEAAEDQERPAPTDVLRLDEVGGHGRRRGSADLRASADERLRRAALPRREPVRDHARRIRQRPGLAG